MQNNRAAPTSAKATGKSQQHETLNFHKTSSQPSERARLDYDLTVQRDWGRNDRRISGHRTTRDSPMLRRWQNEAAKEQPYNAIKDTEHAWAQNSGVKGGQARSSSGESPMLQRWRNGAQKEQPYHAIGAVGVRAERSFVPPEGGENA